MTAQYFLGEHPQWIGSFPQPLPSFMFVHDMLVKTPKQVIPRFPEALRGLEDMYWSATRIPSLSHHKRYCYVSAKRQPMGPGASFSRPGWHIDGFLSEDDTFVYSDSFPTEYNTSRFSLTEDHDVSLQQMAEQVNPRLTRTMSAEGLYRISRRCVHRVALPQVAHVRTFVKIVFSDREFNLEGNAINPWLRPRFPMVSRSHSGRNDPKG